MHIRHRPRGRMIASLLTLAGPAALAAPPQYQIISLGTLGGSESAATAINDAGEVVGIALTPDDLTITAFIYRNGMMQDLGSFGGDSYASGINNLGVVVGDSQIAPGDDSHGFYHDGILHDIGTLPGGPQSYLFAINDAGDMVGQSDVMGATPAEDTTKAILYRNGQIIDLGTLGGPYSGATAINQSSQIVGYTALPLDPGTGFHNRAFLWDNGTMQDLGTLDDDTDSEAYGINAAGHVVGTSTSADGLARAFWYDGTMMRDLGSLVELNSVLANGINDSDIIVGDAFVDDSTTHPFVYQDGEMYDLQDYIDDPDMLWILLSAAAINNSGQIVGTGIFDGEVRAYLATPVPEPAALGVLACGLALMGRRRRQS